MLKISASNVLKMFLFFGLSTYNQSRARFSSLQCSVFLKDVQVSLVAFVYPHLEHPPGDVAQTYAFYLGIVLQLSKLFNSLYIFVKTIFYASGSS